jgi:hypothetical protein
LDICFKNEGQECKAGPVRGWILMGGKVNGEGEGGQIWSIYIIDLYESRTIKPAEITLSRGGGE